MFVKLPVTTSFKIKVTSLLLFLSFFHWLILKQVFFKKCCFDYQILKQWLISSQVKYYVISNETKWISLCGCPVAAKQITAHAQLTMSAFWCSRGAACENYCSSCGTITDFSTRIRNHAYLLFSYWLLKPVCQRVRDQILQVTNIIWFFEFRVKLHCLHVHEML